MGLFAGECGSCRICTRPIPAKFFTVLSGWDAAVWCYRLMTRRCPDCKHGFRAHRQQLGTYRVEPAQVRTSVTISG